MDTRTLSGSLLRLSGGVLRSALSCSSSGLLVGLSPLVLVPVSLRLSASPGVSVPLSICSGAQMIVRHNKHVISRWASRDYNVHGTIRLKTLVNYDSAVLNPVYQVYKRSSVLDMLV